MKTDSREGGCLLRPELSVSDKYAFIDVEKAQYPIVKMCTWLGVSTSGYDEWRNRPAWATAARRDRLAALITAIFTASDRLTDIVGSTPL